MNPNELKRLFPNATASLIAVNADHPELPVQRKTREKTALLRPKLERVVGNGTMGARKKEKRNTGRFLVRVTSIRRRLLDEDNLCEKYIVDCCRYAGLLPGDTPGEAKIEVCQKKASKAEPETTLVEIFTLQESET